MLAGRSHYTRTPNTSQQSACAITDIASTEQTDVREHVITLLELDIARSQVVQVLVSTKLYDRVELGRVKSRLLRKHPRDREERLRVHVHVEVQVRRARRRLALRRELHLLVDRAKGQPAKRHARLHARDHQVGRERVRQRDYGVRDVVRAARRREHFQGCGLE